jgi:hypothetical protein
MSALHTEMRIREKLVAKAMMHIRGLLGLVVVAGLAGCAAQSAPGGDPGARPLPPGTSCQSLRGDLNKMDSRGVPAKVEQASSGKKLSPGDKSDVDRYNQLLNYYLGGRCHV